MLKVEVIFGNPALGCKGAGICRINAQRPESRTQGAGNMCRRTGAFLIARSGNVRELRFVRAALSPCTLKSQFGKNTLEIPERIDLPKKIVDALTLKQKSIFEGVYRLMELGEWIVLRLAD